MLTLLLPYVATLATAPAPPLVPPPPKPAVSAEPEVEVEPEPEVKVAPEPKAEVWAADGAPFEIGGFMKRPPPPPPVEPPAPEDVETKLVWGFHHPVAAWKRRGLIGSVVVTGVGAVGSVVSLRLANRQLQEIYRNLTQMHGDRFWNVMDARALCRANVVQSGTVTVVGDGTLARQCARFENLRITYQAAVAISVVGALSTVTFGILHAVRRVPVRRVEARSDGFAVRF